MLPPPPVSELVRHLVQTIALMAVVALSLVSPVSASGQPVDEIGVQHPMEVVRSTDAFAESATATSIVAVESIPPVACAGDSSEMSGSDCAATLNLQFRIQLEDGRMATRSLTCELREQSESDIIGIGLGPSLGPLGITLGGLDVTMVVVTCDYGPRCGTTSFVALV